MDHKIARFNNLSKEKKETLLLGIRYIILSNLTEDIKEDFERTLENGTDDDLFIFGMERIPNFASELEKLILEINNIQI